MLTMDQLTHLRVYVPRKPARPKRGQEAPKPNEPKKLGRVHELVFSSDGRRVVGVMVKRPDIAGMVKQEDVFCALDSLEVHEGGLMVTRDKESFDARACARLGIDLDACFIWAGMDVRTRSGKPLGRVVDARFDEATGAVDCFCAQEGSAATALVGNFEIPAAWLVCYDGRSCMIVRDEAAQLSPSGGLAGKAGEGYAAAKDGAKRAAAKFDAAASVAVDRGSHALGGIIGKAKVELKKGAGEKDGPLPSKAASKKASAANVRQDGAKKPAQAPQAQKAARAVGAQLGKTRGMFSGFMREFKDASK